MRISVDGVLPPGVTSKDVILHIIGLIGTAGGTGCVVEYAGSVFRDFSMEARMSVCNMSIEAGARAGMVAPDEVTFKYLKGRPCVYVIFLRPHRESISSPCSRYLVEKPAREVASYPIGMRSV